MENPEFAQLITNGYTIIDVNKTEFEVKFIDLNDTILYSYKYKGN